jgi:RNA polymerase sigma factor (sigma-70 family)
MHEQPSQAVIGRLVSNQREFLAFLQRKVGDHALAEDILQEAFVRSMTKAEGVRDEESAVAWFYRVLRNTIIDHARRCAAVQRKLAAFAAELEQVEAEPELSSQVCGCVRVLAETLKPEYAEALRRIDVEGMSVKAFAEAAGISANNASVRVFRAREALRAQLSRCCGGCAEHGCVDCTCRHDTPAAQS